MSLSTDPHVLAALLLEARDLGRALAPPSRQAPDFTLERAYEVAACAIEARARRGERMVGRKIGFSNRALWPVYGIGAPMWGAVWDTTLQWLDDTQATMSLAGLTEPRLEPEIVLGLRAAPRAGASADELADAIDWVAHGIEIVQSPFAGWQFAAADTVAAFGLHARLLVGPRVPVAAIGRHGLADTLASLGLDLALDGRPVESGRGANALGGPLQALGFLADTLAAQRTTLPALPALGDAEIVTTGTLTDAAWLRAGQTWRTHIAGAPLPGLTLRVSA